MRNRNMSELAGRTDSQKSKGVYNMRERDKTNEQRSTEKRVDELEASKTRYKRKERISQEALKYAESIFETVREPLLVLDSDLRVVKANRSFYNFFRVTPEETIGDFIYDLGNRQWNIPGLRTLLEYILPEDNKFDGYEVEHEFSSIGRKIMLLNARQITQKEAGSRMILLAIEDITERKQSEKELQESEERYKRISEELTDYLYTVRVQDGHAVGTKHGKGCKAVTGYTAKEFAADPDLWIRMVPAEERDQIIERVQKVLAGEAVPPVEHRIVRKDGQVRWVIETTIQQFDSRMKLILYDGVIKDITEQKQAEETIREGLERFNQIAEQTRSMIWEVDVEGLYTYVSRACKPITGYTPDEIIRKMHFYDLHPEDGRESYKKSAFAVIKKKKRFVDLPNRILTKDGREIWVSTSGMPVLSIRGNLIGYRGSDYDITSSKQTEEKLKISEDKYRTIFENAVEGIFQTTPEGRYISVNPALAKMKGYDAPEELINGITNISKQTYVNPEDRVKYKEILEEKGIVQGFEPRHYRKDGSIIWVSINSRVVRDPTGKALYYEGTIEDITARKTADEKFKQNAEKLRKALSGTIKALSMTVEARDPYTAGHQKKVSNLARLIAQHMVLPDDTIDNIRIAGIIHDVGKISIPAEILSKPGALTDIEMSLIKVHSQAGYDILKDVGLPYPIAEIVLQHHERLDGSGYPQGLKNDRILLESRIIAVADIVEAMASHRPYRPGCGIDAALEEIEKNKGILYDAGVVDACVKLFREKGFKFE